MHLFILGANGFIGNWLVRYLLDHTPWTLTGIDLADSSLTDPLDKVVGHPRFEFYKGDMIQESAWVEEQIKRADLVLPLAAIANPALYVSQPLKVFQLDFEANLALVKLCVTHQKRLVFPSTSEVYGMSSDAEFDEESSPLVVGPTRTSRWIYSASKQLMDRVIHAYGEQEGLSYTLFRPFNWVGPRLDTPDIHRPGTYRAFTQFISQAVRGEDIFITGTGDQRRAFIFITDALEALRLILENEGGVADNKIFNIGNPANNLSMNKVAEKVVVAVRGYPSQVQKAYQTRIVHVEGKAHFGSSYADVDRRVPSIRRAQELLGWTPLTSFDEAIDKTLAFYLGAHPLWKKNEYEL